MSRIGKKPVEIPPGVKVNIAGSQLIVAGPKGELRRNIPQLLSVSTDSKKIFVSRLGESRLHRSLHGLLRTLIANMIEGVAFGFEKKLEVHGTGYRAEVKDGNIVLQIGFSHPVTFNLPEGVDADIKKEGQITRIRLTGIDKEILTDTAARLRATFAPEPYKGKGIRYEGEMVRRKAGKATVK